MNNQSIKLTDWQRILFGEAPPEFLIEVIIRVLFTYLVLLVIIRLLGKRMSGQLTITEMVVMLTLGAIISQPMQMPDRGILQGILLLLFVLGFQRGLTWLIYKHGKVERVTQGHMALLVKDGVIQLNEMDKVNLSREQLFAALRNEGIYNLGRVKRVYQEANGDFSIYDMAGEQAGLDILPDGDNGIHAMLQPDRQHRQVCSNCGRLRDAPQQLACTECGNTGWETAVQ